MAIASSLWTQLQTSLDQDTPVTSNLLATLEQERQALEQRDYEAFQQILADKQGQLQQLEQHAEQRQALMHQAGFNSEQALLDCADTEAPAVARSWRQLAEQWQQCRQANQVNERIAQRTKLVVSQMLDILRGQNSQSKLYDSKGDTRHNSGGRTITSA